MVKVWKDKEDWEYKHSTPSVEKPDRINQLLYNLARGHAITCGRTTINDEDIGIVLEVALNSAHPHRVRTLIAILESDIEEITSNYLEAALDCSKPTALKEMETLKVLGIVDIDESASGTCGGRPETVIRLKDKFQWFRSDEFKNLRRKEAQGQIHFINPDKNIDTDIQPELINLF